MPQKYNGFRRSRSLSGKERGQGKQDGIRTDFPKADYLAGMQQEMFRSERLIFRTWSDQDVPAFAAINADRQVMRYFPAPLSVEETRAMITRLQEHQAEHGYCFWACEQRSDRQLIGMIGLSRPKMETAFTPCVEIGWRLHPSFWGKGLATEGAQACLDHGWNVLGLDEIVSFTAGINVPSIRVMERIGMVADGTFVHPKIPADHRLQPHVLYRIQKPTAD